MLQTGLLMPLLWTLHTCSMRQGCDVVGSSRQAVKDPRDAHPDSQGGVVRRHGMAQLCQQA